MGNTDAGSGEETRVSYRWSCPYCNTSRVSRGDDERKVCNRAKSAVRAHMYGSIGDEHGPRASAPNDFRPASHVERILD